MAWLNIDYYAYLEASGFFAPFLFIALHLFRPLLFLPIIMLCMVGGIWFGIVAGTIYSMVGIMLSSIVFYILMKYNPRGREYVFSLKGKLIGEKRKLSTSQITILRLVPFIHFYALSLCLLEIHADFKTYLRASFISIFPFSIVYTSIGTSLIHINNSRIFIAVGLFFLLFFMLRRKETVINWTTFFSQAYYKKNA
ncbi:TVP38/TMEM64 family protein [Saliterribacillus persicus]|uniref:TVP38/TMEM64 family membrane protein n=1 Tax=Saliterribacillus persicus TaxID=930114 RepID=A0A368XFC4_9BACI|nr:VTT domain-containing protein [Saliterribacillus persicus]RCW66339.1 putative membrane protein YdjX (TVP38/TMEM64 family) [Saliterribacillus persicus]